MEQIEGPNGIRGVRLEAPEDGVDSEVWLGSLTLGALARLPNHPSTKRAKELKIALSESFMDATPYEIYGDDIELLREALEKDIAEPRPHDGSEFLQHATESYVAEANKLLAALPSSSK